MRRVLAKEMKALGRESISRTTFASLIAEKTTSRKLLKLGIDIHRMPEAFSLIDTERTNSLTPEVVARRLLGLRGDATSRDLSRLRRELVQIKRKLSKLGDSMCIATSTDGFGETVYGV